jgi:hypothetical protein
MRPRQHAGGLVFVEQFEPREQPQQKLALASVAECGVSGQD